MGFEYWVYLSVYKCLSGLSTSNRHTVITYVPVDGQFRLHLLRIGLTMQTVNVVYTFLRFDPICPSDRKIKSFCVGSHVLRPVMNTEILRITEEAS